MPLMMMTKELSGEWHKKRLLEEKAPRMHSLPTFMCTLNQQLGTIQRKKKYFSFERNRWGRRKYNNERYFITKREKKLQRIGKCILFACLYIFTNKYYSLNTCMDISCKKNYCGGGACAMLHNICSFFHCTTNANYETCIHTKS